MPFSATHVVWAVSTQLLGSGLKVVWFQHYALDHGPDGCYASARDLGERIGMPEATVATYRQELVGMELLLRLKPRGWAPVLPPECIPESQKLGVLDRRILVGRLEGHLRKMRKTGSGSDGARIGVRAGPGPGSGVIAETDPDPDPTFSTQSPGNPIGPGPVRSDLRSESLEKTQTSEVGSADRRPERSEEENRALWRLRRSSEL